MSDHFTDGIQVTFSSGSAYLTVLNKDGTSSFFDNIMQHGNRVQFFTVGGVLPTGILPDKVYYLRPVNSNYLYINISSDETSFTLLPYVNAGTSPIFMSIVNNRPCTVDSTTDTITSPNHGFSNGMKIQFYAGTMADNLTEDTTYYIINSSTNTFQVAATSGGNAIDITSNGVDMHWAYVMTLPVTVNVTDKRFEINSFFSFKRCNKKIKIIGDSIPGGLSSNTIYYTNPVPGVAYAFGIMSSPSSSSNINITSTGSNVSIEYVEKNMVGVLNLPKDLIEIGRTIVPGTSYRLPPDSNNIKSGVVIDGITGTAAGGGESWS